MKFLSKLQKKNAVYGVMESVLWVQSGIWYFVPTNLKGKLYILRVEKYEPWVLFIYDIHIINVTY